MDEELVELIDNMLAKGWSNDPNEETRPFAYISIGHLLIVCEDGKPTRKFRLTEVN